MDYLEKPPIEKKWLIIKCIIVSLLLTFSLLLGVSSLNSAKQYETASRHPLKLQAKITHVDVEFDDEYGDDYYAMMEYVHDGVKYEGRYKRFGSQSKAEELLGKTVTISVDPENPGDRLSEINENGRIKLILGSIFLMVAVWVLRISHRKSYIDTYGWRRDAIKKDILYKMCQSPAEELIIMVIYYFSVASMCPAFYMKTSLLNLIVLAVAVIGLVKLVRKLAVLKKVKSDAFVLRRDTFVSKQSSSDDDSTTYKVTYENVDGRWTKQVSRKVYDRASEGDVIESVYLEGEPAPILNRASSGEVF